MNWEKELPMKRSKVITQFSLVLCSFLLILPLTACSNEAKQRSTYQPLKLSLTLESLPSLNLKDEGEEITNKRQIQITTTNDHLMTFELNDSEAAETFYSQLSFSVLVENYGSDEKIFYPPKKLDTSNTPLAKGPIGTLAYYEPWGNVVIYYGECDGANGLYALGEIVSGVEFISEMEGEISIDIASASSGNNEPENKPNISDLPSENPSETLPPIHPPLPEQTLPPIQNTPVHQPPTSTESQTQPKEENVKNIQVTVGNKTFSATLEENIAVESFVELMKESPVEIAMSDYANFEKVGSLGTSLPESNKQMTTQSGDIVLYNGNQIVVFYGSNTWNYTKLGRIDDLSGWEESLGSGDVMIAFSIES